MIETQALSSQSSRMTVKQFAALQSVWPEYFDPRLHSGKNFLIARIHPKHNRPIGDENVLARALAYINDEYGNHLGRLTIRSPQLKDRDFEVCDFAKMYKDCLLAIMELPIITLSDS